MSSPKAAAKTARRPKLKVVSGTPGTSEIALFWIDFSGPIENYRR